MHIGTAALPGRAVNEAYGVWGFFYLSMAAHQLRTIDGSCHSAQGQPHHHFWGQEGFLPHG